MKFLHSADLHLGHGRTSERRDDYLNAWRWCIGTAHRHAVDAVVVAGDLFDSVRPSPEIFQLAYDAVPHPCPWRWIITPGYTSGHDHPGASGHCWTTVFGELLNAEDSTRPIGEVRFFYPKPGTIPSQIEELRERIAICKNNEPASYCVAILHLGLAPQMPIIGGGLDPEVLAPLLGLADYVALGHCHAPGSYAGWAHWPGAPEWTSVSQYVDTGGVILVEVERDQDSHVLRSSIRHIPYPHRRRLMTLTLDASMYASPRMLALGTHGYGVQNAVVDVRLTGVLQFPRSTLDLRAVEAAILARGAIEVIIRDETTARDAPVLEPEQRSRDEMMGAAIREIISQDSRWTKISTDLVAAGLLIAQLCAKKAPPEDILAAVPTEGKNETL